MRQRFRLTTMVVIAVGTFLSVAAVTVILSTVHNSHREEAERATAQLVENLATQFALTERKLGAAAAQITAMRRLDPAQFEVFFETLDAPHGPPFVTGISFALAIEPGQIDALAQRMEALGDRFQAVGYPAFPTLTETPGRIHYPVLFAVGEDDRATRFGRDLAAEDGSIDALRRALMTNTAALGDPVRPAKEAAEKGDIAEGVTRVRLIYPVRLSNAVSEELSIRSSLGVVTALIEPAAFMRLALQRSPQPVESLALVLDQGTGSRIAIDGDPRERLAGLPRIGRHTMAHTGGIQVGDQVLRVEATSLHWFHLNEIATALAVAFLSVACTGLLAAYVQRKARESQIVQRELLTKQAALERAAEASTNTQKMEALGRLVGGVAHDFNNLLTVILGNLELMREGAPAKDRDLFIDEALQATERGRSLTRQLLAFGRRSQLDPVAMDLGRVLTDCDRMLRRVLPATIDIQTVSSGGLWPVSVDRNLLDNALLNLALNARDAMPAGGCLTLEAANLRLGSEYVTERGEELPPGRYVMLAVSDTGQGMSAEVAAHAFEPFYTTKGVGEGSGLGLSMVFGFVTQSGGSARIYSEQGVGTTVKLFFPIDENADIATSTSPNAAADEQVPLTPDAVSGAGARVLLAEDDPGVRRVLAGQMRNAGYRVTIAENGDRALELLDNGIAVDLLLTDIVMPGEVQGPALAKVAVTKRPGLHVIFISGYPQEAAVHGNGISQRQRVLQKPVNRDELIQALRGALVA